MPLVLLLLIAASGTAAAGTFRFIPPRPIHELWLNPGMYSYHFQQNKGLNSNNFGLGAEYRYSTVSSITAGTFRNSDRQSSRYVGWYWQPLAAGHARLGASIGVINGYPKMRNGGWFPALIPTASIEYGRAGINLMFIPGYKDRLYGALSFQIKFKVY